MIKKKVFLIIDTNDRIEQVFLKRFAAIGWLKNYRNSLPKSVEAAYWNRYKIVPSQLSALDKIDEGKLMKVLNKLKFPGETRVVGVYFATRKPKDNSTVKILNKSFCVILAKALIQRKSEWLG